MRCCSKKHAPRVLQSHALYLHTTAAQNLSFGMRMPVVPPLTIASKLARAVAIVLLRPCFAMQSAELSGGKALRVAIGCALVQEPSQFLFNEPLSYLEAELRQPMGLEIEALHCTVGTTMICVRHEQVEAMTLPYAERRRLGCGSSVGGTTGKPACRGSRPLRASR